MSTDAPSGQPGASLTQTIQAMNASCAVLASLQSTANGNPSQIAFLIAPAQSAAQAWCATIGPQAQAAIQTANQLATSFINVDYAKLTSILAAGGDCTDILQGVNANVAANYQAATTVQNSISGLDQQLSACNSALSGDAIQIQSQVTSTQADLAGQQNLYTQTEQQLVNEEFVAGSPTSNPFPDSSQLENTALQAQIAVAVDQDFLAQAQPLLQQIPIASQAIGNLISGCSVFIAKLSVISSMLNDLGSDEVPLTGPLASAGLETLQLNFQDLLTYSS